MIATINGNPHTHTRMHTHTRAHKHTHTSTHTQAHLRTHTQAHLHTHTREREIENMGLFTLEDSGNACIKNTFSTTELTWWCCWVCRGLQHETCHWWAAQNDSLPQWRWSAGMKAEICEIYQFKALFVSKVLLAKVLTMKNITVTTQFQWKAAEILFIWISQIVKQLNTRIGYKHTETIISC